MYPPGEEPNQDTDITDTTAEPDLVTDITADPDIVTVPDCEDTDDDIQVFFSKYIFTIILSEKILLSEDCCDNFRKPFFIF